jgi:hypothetical protein
MIATSPRTESEALEERLARGMDLLFDMELRGEQSDEYRRYLRFWTQLLAQYEGAGVAVGEPATNGIVPRSRTDIYL